MSLLSIESNDPNTSTDRKAEIANEMADLSSKSEYFQDAEQMSSLRSQQQSLQESLQDAKGSDVEKITAQLADVSSQMKGIISKDTYIDSGGKGGLENAYSAQNKAQKSLKNVSERAAKLKTMVPSEESLALKARIEKTSTEKEKTTGRLGSLFNRLTGKSADDTKEATGDKKPETTVLSETTNPMLAPPAKPAKPAKKVTFAPTLDSIPEERVDDNQATLTDSSDAVNPITPPAKPPRKPEKESEKSADNISPLDSSNSSSQIESSSPEASSSPEDSTTN